MAIETGIVKENDGNLVCTSNSRSQSLYELLSYAPFFNMTEEEYINAIKYAIDNGVLMEENGKFVGVSQYDMSVLEEKCKQNGMGVQSVIDKMTKMIGG